MTDQKLVPTASGEPDKIVKRRGNFTQKGKARDLSLASVNTADTLNTDAGSQVGYKPNVEAASRLSSKLSVESAGSRLSVESAGTVSAHSTPRLPSRPSSVTGRPSSGKSKTLQGGGKHILEERRHSTVESSPSLPLEKASLPGRSSSNEPTGRRASFAESSAGVAAADSVAVARPSVLDMPYMSPRTARKHNLHKHRMSMEGESPPMHKHQSRRGSHLGAESLDIMMQQRDRYMHEPEDPKMCGFRVGDNVSVADGPDADGPWKKMGDGEVRGFGNVRGFVKVYFIDGDEEFPMKAVNLLNLTEHSRSGKHIHQKEEEQFKERQADSGASCMERGIRTVGVRSATNTGIRAIEPTPYTFRDGIEACGLEIGDWVGDNSSSGNMTALGVVVREGDKPGTVLVRVGDLGIRSFAAAALTKMESNHNKEKAARRASFIDPRNSKKFTLSIDEARTAFAEENVYEPTWKKDNSDLMRAKKGVAAIAGYDPMHGFPVMAFVQVKPSAKNPTSWASLGMGCVRGPGQEEGSITVQFDNGCETWDLAADTLELVPQKQTSDRAFYLPSEERIQKRRGGK